MEEMLGNVAGARQIFERWMQWEPDHHGWMAYIKVGRMGLSRCKGGKHEVAAGVRVAAGGEHRAAFPTPPCPSTANCCIASLPLIHCAHPQMELRYGEVERARQIYERYVKCLPSGARSSTRRPGSAGGASGRGLSAALRMSLGCHTPALLSALHRPSCRVPFQPARLVLPSVANPAVQTR